MLWNCSTRRRGGRRGRRGGPCGARDCCACARHNDSGRGHQRRDGHQETAPDGARAPHPNAPEFFGVTVAREASRSPPSGRPKERMVRAPCPEGPSRHRGNLSSCPSVRLCSRPTSLRPASPRRARAPHGPPLRPLRPLRPPRLRVGQFRSHTGLDPPRSGGNHPLADPRPTLDNLASYIELAHTVRAHNQPFRRSHQKGSIRWKP